MAKADVTLRRQLQQIVHCCQEALSVVENSESYALAISDLEQAQLLIGEHALPELRKRDRLMR